MKLTLRGRRPPIFTDNSTNCYVYTVLNNFCSNSMMGFKIEEDLNILISFVYVKVKKLYHLYVTYTTSRKNK